jgi:Spy/CpxP family protein refolding chaperone
MLRFSTMKTLNGKSLVAVACGFVIALLVFSAPVVHAQTNAPAPQQDEATAPQNNTSPNDAAGLLSRLNLSPEQVTQMREIQGQSVPEARQLTRRLNQTRRALDAAIYADTVDEALIQQRAHDVAEAQAALVNFRAQTELRVRRVLTPEQLQTFRILRQQAQQQRRIQRQLNRGVNPQRPAQNGLNGDNPNRQNRMNQRPNAPADQTPNAPLRERRRNILRRP